MEDPSDRPDAYSSGSPNPYDPLGQVLHRVAADAYDYAAFVQFARGYSRGTASAALASARADLERALTRAADAVAYGHALATLWRQSTTAHTELAATLRTQAALMAYSAGIAPVVSEFSALESRLGLVAAGWDSPVWTRFEADAIQLPSPLIRIGELEASNGVSLIRAPALVPLVGGRSLLLEASGDARINAIAALQSVALRLLAVIPPGRLRFTLIDPVGLGSNVGGFMRLPDELIGGRAWIEPQHIEQRLADLSEHMALVIQKYLRNQFATMEEYNAAAGEVAEPYRVVVIPNFPVNFTDAAASRLISIATSGPRTGVYVLAAIAMEQPLPHGFNLADLERVSTVVKHDGKRFRSSAPALSHCEVHLDGQPPTAQFDRVVQRVGDAAVGAAKVQVPFQQGIPPERDWWKGDSRSGLRAAIGRAGATAHQYVEFGRGTAQHALVAGKTGSGKSTLLHVLIASLAVTYPPDELELYLVDFKKGVEFKDYATYRLPHAAVIAIQSEREFGLSVLVALDAEMQRRGDLLREAGYQHLAAYRDGTRAVLPRIVLVVDEFQEFFAEDDQLARQAASLLDRLARQGRAFGIHLILGSQSLSSAYGISRSTTDQMAIRIALQCSDADSRLILSDDNPGARLLGRPGEAIYNAENGLVEGNALFQVFWLSDSDREECLRRIAAKDEEAGTSRARSLVIFEGDAPARLEDSDLGNSPQRSSAASAQKWRALLGDSVEIGPPTAAIFDRQSRANLLLVGQDEESAAAMFVSTLLSLSVQSDSAAGVTFRLLDLSGTETPAHAGLLAAAQRLPERLRYDTRRQAAEAISETAKVVEARRATPDTLASSVFFLVFGAHRARELRSDDPYTPSPAGAQLASILQDGPELGVHTVMWTDTYVSLERTLSRRSLGEFDLRVGLRMSPADSMNLLDSPVASRLSSYRAVLVDQERADRPVKFRPYQIPGLDWLAEFQSGPKRTAPPDTARSRSRTSTSRTSQPSQSVRSHAENPAPERAAARSDWGPYVDAILMHSLIGEELLKAQREIALVVEAVGRRVTARFAASTDVLREVEKRLKSSAGRSAVQFGIKVGPGAAGPPAAPAGTNLGTLLTQAVEEASQAERQAASALALASKLARLSAYLSATAGRRRRILVGWAVLAAAFVVALFVFQFHPTVLWGGALAGAIALYLSASNWSPQFHDGSASADAADSRRDAQAAETPPGEVLLVQSRKRYADDS